MSPKDLIVPKQTVISRFKCDLENIHGLAHWDRVFENGKRISESNGADKDVVTCFAFLHDCCRESDCGDYGHGKRAAEFAATLRDSVVRLNDDQFGLLSFACEFHAKGLTSEDPTVGACWDADRLDLGRVGVVPSPQFMSTAIAKRQEFIEWAQAQSVSWSWEQCEG